jgi:Protein of unknown function (DUF3618)
MTAGNPPGGDRTAGPAPPPSDPRQLREEILRTRAELGDTVEALAGRLDVRARAREAAAAARQRARDRAEAVTRAVAGRGAQLKEQIGGAAAQATGGVGGEAAPDQAAGVAGQARATAVRGGLPLAAVAGVVLVCWLAWRWRRS